MPGEIATRSVAIRNQCIECMGYAAHEVKECSAPECWLYPYRMGKEEVDEESSLVRLKVMVEKAS